MPSSSPSTPRPVLPPTLPANSLTKPFAGVRNSAQAALAAAERTFQTANRLPFEVGPPSDPSQTGRQRLKGAFLLDVSRIRPDPKQPRREFDEEEQKGLTASVVERGLKQPLRVWYVPEENVYQIVSGERRYRAALAAGMMAVPCIAEDASGVLPRKEILVDQIVENWQRADLKPFELSDALAELRDLHGLTQDDIARLTGKPKSEISRLLSLQKVAPAIQQAVRTDESGTLSRRHLVAVAQLPVDEQPGLVEKIRGGGLSATETEREAARWKQQRTGQAARGVRAVIRRYVVGPATIQITFRKREVTPSDVLNVLDRVRGMVERDAEAEASNRNSAS